LLPATTWGEKEGTVTNSERRITRVRASRASPRAKRVTIGKSSLDLAQCLESRSHFQASRESHELCLPATILKPFGMSTAKAREA
jgi:predicted molibdopterin-dependent oxidoreductase YjgC